MLHLRSSRWDPPIVTPLQDADQDRRSLRRSRGQRVRRRCQARDMFELQ